jgi:hypothetical protein
MTDDRWALGTSIDFEPAITLPTINYHLSTHYRSSTAYPFLRMACPL